MSAALCHARCNTTSNQHRGLKLQKSLSIEQTQDKTGKCCFFGPFRWKDVKFLKNSREQSCRVFCQLSESELLASVRPPQLEVHWIGDSCRPAVCATFAAPGTSAVCQGGTCPHCANMSAALCAVRCQAQHNNQPPQRSEGQTCLNM